MDPVVPCAAAQVQRVTPVIEVAAPGYVLVCKTCIDPVSQAVTEYCEATKLRVRLATNPPFLFRGRARLTCNRVERIAVDPLMLQLGVLTQDGPGWLIGPGVLANPLSFLVHGLSPSWQNEDIEFTLTLEATPGQEVDAPAQRRMTVVELTLDIDDCARRPNGPVPQQLGPYAKVLEGAVVVADSPALPLARTKLTLRRARPYDFPGQLQIVVHEEHRGHAVLCSGEDHHAGGQSGHVISIGNPQIPLFYGASCYVQGLLDSGDDDVLVKARVEGGDFGDYVNLFVDRRVELRWGAAWAYPACSPALLPDSVHEGDDRDANLCSAELIIDTAGFPAGAVANVTIHRCNAARAVVDVSGLAGLTLNVQGQVVTATGQRPVFSSVGRNRSWAPWNAPYFSFTVDFPDQGINRSTPGDPVAQQAQCLKLKYLHAFVVDSTAAELEPGQCRNQILSHIKGESLDEGAEAIASAALVDHRFLRPNLAGLAGGFADWLAVAKNTYAYFHFCHGGFRGVPGEDSFYCSFSFNKQGINFVQVQKHASSADGAGRRDFPRHLMFLASCHSALDPRLARWLIAMRADCYVIGFRRTITRPSVQAMAGRFFHEWLVLRQGDPAQIPACYAIASADHGDIEPCLFHKDSDFTFRPLD